MENTQDRQVHHFSYEHISKVTRMPLITVYNSPTDYPGKFVARLWDIDKPNAPREIRLLQRWCNNRLIFRAEPDFYKYDPKRG